MYGHSIAGEGSTSDNSCVIYRFQRSVMYWQMTQSWLTGSMQWALGKEDCFCETIAQFNYCRACFFVRVNFRAFRDFMCSQKYAQIHAQ